MPLTARTSPIRATNRAWVAWDTTQGPSTWDNGGDTTAPAGNRGLTHSSESTREGLLMKPMPSTCIQVNELSVRLYQATARARFEGAAERQLMPWTWIATTCELQCINSDHLIARTPQTINYPEGVCVYCGLPANTKDHLLPSSLTGDARRIFVAVVPACARCNSAINDLPDASITARRKKAHASIRRRKQEVLSAPNWTDTQLVEFGPRLRKFIEAKRLEKRGVLEQLSWPHDPVYDLRAFEKSGVENPYALGLIEVSA